MRNFVFIMNQKPIFRKCVKICSQTNKCYRGAQISESLTYYPVNLNISNILPLDKITKPQCHVSKTKYRVAEAGDIFGVKTVNRRSFLHPLKNLNLRTLYR